MLDRRSLDSWMKTGSKDINSVAAEKARKILKDHEPVPMDKDIVVELEKYIKKEAKTYNL